MKKVYLLVGLLFGSNAHATAQVPLTEKPIVVIIPSYKNASWYHRNLYSIFNQVYQNYHVIYIDDCSPDNTAELVQAYIVLSNKQAQCTLIKNQTRQGALANIYHAVHSYDDNAIVVLIDGDDWLSDKYVFERLNNYYSFSDTWMTYGTFKEYPSGSTNWSKELPQRIIDQKRVRTFAPHPSHLRTFYAWLFKKIKQEDLLYKGEFLTMTWDQAIMFPLIEMAGTHQKYIREVMYMYNMATPLNDNKVNAQLQRDLEKYIRALKPYARLT